MTERQSGRPILRKGGQQRRVAAKDTPRSSATRDKPGAEGPRGEETTSAPEKAKSKPKAPPDRAEAEALAHARGIPYIHALRIVRGETTLTDILKTMVQRERVDHLVNEHGIAKALAGQVACGQLARDRALLLTKLRELRGQPFDWDAFRVAQRQGTEIAVLPFGESWQVGRCPIVSTYEFTFTWSEPGEEEQGQRVLVKHDIKAMCRPHCLDLLNSSRRWDEEVQGSGLEGSEVREDQTRPEDQALLDIVAGSRPVNLITRDGECFRGAVRSFGRWDVELMGGRGMNVTIFFHALHPSSDWGG